MDFEGSFEDDERDGEPYDGQGDTSDIGGAGYDGVTAEEPEDGAEDVDDKLPEPSDALSEDPTTVDNEELVPPPIDTLEDVLVTSYLLPDRPDSACAVAHNQVHDAMRQAVDIGELTPALRREVTNYLALGNVLEGRVFPAEQSATGIVQVAYVMDAYGARLDEASGYSAEEVMSEADQIPPGQAIGYLLDKLESHTGYLRNGGDRPENWPVTAGPDSRLQAPDFANNVTIIAELVGRSLDLLHGSLGENEQALHDRLQSWVSDTGGMLLEHRQVGRAAALLNLCDAEHQQPLMDNLVDAMGQIREVESIDAYRQCYSFIVRTLDQNLRDQFAQRTERIGAPAIPGSHQELFIHGDGSFIMVDRYTREDPIIDVGLAGGGTIDLPFRIVEERILHNYGEVDEGGEVQISRNVRFRDLDELAVAAIDRAAEAARGENVPLETVPHYRCLVLRVDKEGGRSLHTLAFNDGAPRSLSLYPGIEVVGRDAAFHAAVTAAEHVSDGYLVLPTDGSNYPPYTDAAPNLFGPGADRANAFWIAGDPRRVWHDLSDPQYMQWSADGRSVVPRWVIIPVQFYRVEEQTSAGA
ncbi:MAG TPA: hypothetical protein VFM05_05995 [Candidatus Saccharimonadales bacterium]|nr:hypothetical protein [Candidatus Saccharimonadales bacterium]